MFFFSYTLVYGKALLFLECGMMSSTIVLEAFATRCGNIDVIYQVLTVTE